jgi:hypothetical protein
MRPHLPILLALAALAAAPVPALAKGAPDAAQVCGTNGCSTVDVSSLPALVDGVTTRPPAHPAPFVTLRTTIDRGPDAGPLALRIDYFPSLGITRPSGSRDASQWVRLSDNDRARLDHVVAPFEPYPAARLALGTRSGHDADSMPWLAIAGVSAAALALLALLARYATSALKARPRASKSAN